MKITHFNNDGSVRGIHTLYDEYHGRLRRAGHVMRMEESDPAKKVLCATPGGSGDRGRGRPQLRRCDELEEDVVRVGCRNWRTDAQSREEWRVLSEEVKCHPGM